MRAVHSMVLAIATAALAACVAARPALAQGTDLGARPAFTRDAAGNVLPPMPPALRENPELLDPAYVRRYLDPGIFGLEIRVGFTVCADWISDGARGCASGRPLGGGADGAVVAHLLEVWKLSFALGLRGGYRFDPAPLAEGERGADTSLVSVGPLLYVQGDAGDWVFGVEAIPLGLAARLSQGAVSGRTTAFDACFEAGAFLGWRAFGHVPVGLFASFTGTMSLPSAGDFPPGAVAVGAFAGRRFGRGRTLLAEE